MAGIILCLCVLCNFLHKLQLHVSALDNGHEFAIFFCQCIMILYTGLYFLISIFRHVINVVFFLLGDSPTSEFCVDVSEHSVSSSFTGDERTECVLSLGNSPAYEFYLPTFRNILSLFQLL